MPPHHTPDFVIVAENTEKKVVLQREVEHIDGTCDAVANQVCLFFETFDKLDEELKEKLIHKIKRYYPNDEVECIG